MSSTAEQIKDRLSIHDVVSGYIKLERAGKNLRARCPFHNEKTPSFFVSPERNAYHCFGCNRGGDIFSFVQEFEGLDFIGALRMLADRAGIEISPIDTKAKSERERLFVLLDESARYFETMLTKHTQAKTYLRDRGLTEESTKLFHIGYASDAWRALRTHFSEKGYTDAELEKVGLIKKSDSKKYYDTFRNRLMFPIYDAARRTIAFSGRLLSEGDVNAPKYLNSPETSLYKKSSVLYGLERARSMIRKYDFCIVVEGQIDVLLAHQIGYSNTVAPLGTALTGIHLDKIHQLTENVVFAFDADSAGLESFKRAAKLALAKGFDVKVVSLPLGKDPADLIADNPKNWKKLVKEAMHTVDFLLDYMREQYSDERTFKKEVSNVVLPFVAHISNKIDQAHFVHRVADVLGVSDTAVYEELEKVSLPEVDDSAADPVETRTPHSRRDMALQRILGMLEWQERVKDTLVDVAAARRRLATLIKSEDLEGWMRVPLDGDLPAHAVERALEAELAFSDTESLDAHLEELFLVLEGEVLQEELTSSLTLLREAEQKKDTPLIESLLARCQELTQKIERVKQALQYTD